MSTQCYVTQVSEDSRGSEFQDKRVEARQGPDPCGNDVELATESHVLQEGRFRV